MGKLLTIRFCSQMIGCMVSDHFFFQSFGWRLQTIVLWHDNHICLPIQKGKTLNYKKALQLNATLISVTFSERVFVPTT